MSETASHRRCADSARKAWQQTAWKRSFRLTRGSSRSFAKPVRTRVTACAAPSPRGHAAPDRSRGSQPVTRLPPGHAAAAQVAEGGASPPSLWTVSHWPGSSHFPLPSDASDSWRGTRGMRAALGPMGLAEAAHCGRVPRRHRACRRACQASLRGVRVRQTPTSASAQGAQVPGLPHAVDPPEQWQTRHPAGEDARVPQVTRRPSR